MSCIVQVCADVAQSVEHLIGNEEVRRFKSARQLQKAFRKAVSLDHGGEGEPPSFFLLIVL